jgi:LAS superfamily LD-carboxypeptidase LdcB
MPCKWARCVAVAAVTWILTACGGSNSTATKSATGSGSMPTLFEFDPFPADIGVWECREFVDALHGTAHEATLQSLLKVRPHQYSEPAHLETLVEMPNALIAANRLERPMYRHLLDPEALESLQRMVDAAQSDGVTLRVQSAYRSPAYQNLMWKLALREFKFDLIGAAFKTAPPCFSQHATGRALDFSDIQSEDSPEYRWLHANASKWGWTQSFSDDSGAVRSPDKVGILVEPWHFRYDPAH